MVTQVLIGALATTALLTGSIAAPTPAPAADEPTQQSTADILVASSAIELPHFWASASIPDLDCPSGAQVRLKGYHDGSGLRVPWGVEVRFIDGWGPDVAMLTVGEHLPGGGFRPTGIRAGTTTNWANGPRRIQVVLHCQPYS